MRKLLALATLLGVTALVAGSAFAGNGPPHPGFYVDGTVYRTVGTPTDFSGTGAPASSFDTIYQFAGRGRPEQFNVATAAPGDRDFNGGRWRVKVLGFPSGYQAAVASGDQRQRGDRQRRGARHGVGGRRRRRRRRPAGVVRVPGDPALARKGLSETAGKIVGRGFGRAPRHAGSQNLRPAFQLPFPEQPAPLRSKRPPAPFLPRTPRRCTGA